MARFDRKIADLPMPEKYFPVLVPGEYRCRVEKVEEKVARETFNKYVEVNLRIVEGKYKNSQLWKRLLLQPETENSERHVKVFVHSLGLDADNPDSYDTDAWEGLECIAEVYIEESERFGKRAVPRWFTRVSEEEKATK